MRTKVCGMTSTEQVLELSRMGIDFSGFIFYPPSARYVYKSMPANAIKKIRSINKVGVFVNAMVEDVLRTIDDCGLHMVQLHGNESPRYCERIADYITVIKVFRISPGDDLLWKIKDYRDVADMFMFDTEGAGYGGTGKKFDWQLLKDLNIHKPFFLSGGIAPGDAESLTEFTRHPAAKDLFAIDINSRFEVAPGIKDMALIKEFIKKVKAL